MKELWYGHWFPTEFAFFFFILAGLLMVLQQKRLAIPLMLLGVGTIVTPQIIEALKPTAIEVASQSPSIIAQLTQDWSITKKIIVAIVILIAILRLILGKEIWSEVIGILISDLIKTIFKAPFIFVRWLFKIIFIRHKNKNHS